MNRKISPVSFYAAMLIIWVFSLDSCSDKEECDPTVSIFGSWTRTYTGMETYHAQFNLKETEISEWIMLDTLSTHTNSYFNIQVTGKQVRCYDDPDFAEDGLYNWTKSGNTLTLTLIGDTYPARITALAGTWNQKNPADFAKIIGTWQKITVDQGISYRVKLTLTTGGILKWEMTDPIPGHTNSSVSFAATDNTIIIHTDPDCDGNGYFTYTVNGTDLTCTYLKDKCPPRSQSFSGTWSKIE